MYSRRTRIWIQRGVRRGGRRRVQGQDQDQDQDQDQVQVQVRDRDLVLG